MTSNVKGTPCNRLGASGLAYMKGFYWYIKCFLKMRDEFSLTNNPMQLQLHWIKSVPDGINWFVWRTAVIDKNQIKVDLQISTYRRWICSAISDSKPLTEAKLQTVWFWTFFSAKSAVEELVLIGGNGVPHCQAMCHTTSGFTSISLTICSKTDWNSTKWCLPASEHVSTIILVHIKSMY